MPRELLLLFDEFILDEEWDTLQSIVGCTYLPIYLVLSLSPSSGYVAELHNKEDYPKENQPFPYTSPQLAACLPFCMPCPSAPPESSLKKLPW
jgi:hypothetical protein